MKRLLIYVHFNKYDYISPHVRYQLQEMRHLFSHVLFVSNSPISEDKLASLYEAHLIDDSLLRGNIGYDFAAWRDGLSHIGYEVLADYDSLTLMNDTCFGPLWDLAPYYERFEADESIDYWGITNHRAVPEVSIPEHVQSYFACYKKDMATSQVFKDFWSQVEDFTDVQQVIDNYEIQATKLFTEAGYTYGVLFNTVGKMGDKEGHANFSNCYPDILLDNRIPFIKVKAFGLNEVLAPYFFDLVSDLTTYPIELIVSHMSDVSYPDRPYLLGQKLLPESHQIRISDASPKKIAVHLHTFYVDLVPDFLEAFQANITQPYDLYITTDTNEKADEITGILAENQITAKILVTGSRGRDIWPMLQLKDDLRGYDYIGHFHTKKSTLVNHLVGESWRRDLMAMLIDRSQDIFEAFDDETIGIVIADIPRFFRYTDTLGAISEESVVPAMTNLWKKMKLEKTIDFSTFVTFVMSYGTFIWFKYDALAPLFELGLTEDDIPQEPLPQGSLLHAIERMFVYIAWSKHYDFRISSLLPPLPAFVDDKVLQKRLQFDESAGLKRYLRETVYVTKKIPRLTARQLKHAIKRIIKR